MINHLDQHENRLAPRRPPLPGQRRFVALLLALCASVAFACGLIVKRLPAHTDSHEPLVYKLRYLKIGKTPFQHLEDCDDPKAPHCTQKGGGNTKLCGYCSMPCNGEGKKPEDRRCSTFCCEDRCDCSPPCS